MMYRTVSTETWQDPWFVDLQPHAKCLFLYLFTNPRVTACGSMEVSISQIAFETKIPARKVEHELRAFGEKIAWWPDRNLIIVRNFYRHQRAKSSENFAVAARKAIAVLFDDAKSWVWSVYPELKEGMVSAKPSQGDGIPNPSPTQGDKETVTVTATGQVTETGVTPPPPSKKRSKPAETTIPDDFAVTPEMRAKARDRFDLTDEQIDAKTERFKTWAVAKGQTYARWDAGWLNFMEPKSWDQNGPPGPNGHALRSVTADHAGEDREYLMRGLPPVWGSANGGIDSL